MPTASPSFCVTQRARQAFAGEQPPVGKQNKQKLKLRRNTIELNMQAHTYPAGQRLRLPDRAKRS